MSTKEQAGSVLVLSPGVVISPSLISRGEKVASARGAFCDMFSGTSISHGKVALKRLRFHADKEAFERRFSREVNMWCRLKHLYILPFLGVVYVEGLPHMISPWMENGHINVYLAEAGPVNRWKLLWEVANGILYLHSRGVVHGDIKGNNILITSKGEASIGDFGLSKLYESEGSDTTSIGLVGAGAVRWMAPELFRGVSKSRESDVYSFGCVIIEVAAGEKPFAHIQPDIAVITRVISGDEQCRPINDVASRWLTDAMWIYVQQLMEKDPSCRLRTDGVETRMRSLYQTNGFSLYQPEGSCDSGVFVYTDQLPYYPSLPSNHASDPQSVNRPSLTPSSLRMDFLALSTQSNKHDIPARSQETLRRKDRTMTVIRGFPATPECPDGIRSYIPIKRLFSGTSAYLCDWHSALPPATPVNPMQLVDLPEKRRDWATKRLVAIKTLAMLRESSFSIEDLRCARLSPHPSVITVYDVFAVPEETKIFCVFEAMEATLGLLIESRRKHQHPFSSGLIASLFRQLISGLAHLHEEQYVHSDLRPENLLVTSTGYATYCSMLGGESQVTTAENDSVIILKIADFSSASGVASRPISSKASSSLWYRAPEILLDVKTWKCAPPVDIWSLGVIMAEVVTLSPLFISGGDIEQMKRLLEVLGDLTADFGVDECGIQFGGGPWPGGVQAASVLGMIFLPQRHSGLRRLFHQSVPTSLVKCVSEILKYDPARRLTAIEVSKHQYFIEDTYSTVSLQSQKSSVPNNGSNVLSHLPQPSCSQSPTSTYRPSQPTPNCSNGPYFPKVPTHGATYDERVDVPPDKERSGLKSNLADASLCVQVPIMFGQNDSTDLPQDNHKVANTASLGTKLSSVGRLPPQEVQVTANLPYIHPSSSVHMVLTDSRLNSAFDMSLPSQAQPSRTETLQFRDSQAQNRDRARQMVKKHWDITEKNPGTRAFLSGGVAQFEFEPHVETDRTLGRGSMGFPESVDDGTASLRAHSLPEAKRRLDGLIAEKERSKAQRREGDSDHSASLHAPSLYSTFSYQSADHDASRSHSHHFRPLQDGSRLVAVNTTNSHPADVARMPCDSDSMELETIGEGDQSRLAEIIGSPLRLSLGDQQQQQLRPISEPFADVGSDGGHSATMEPSGRPQALPPFAKLAAISGRFRLHKLVQGKKSGQDLE